MMEKFPENHRNTAKKQTKNKRFRSRTTEEDKHKAELKQNSKNSVNKAAPIPTFTVTIPLLQLQNSSKIKASNS